MNQIKLKRIESELCKTVSDILANEARDQLMHTITVTGSQVANDLSFAKIYFTSLADMDHKELEKELEEAAGFVRNHVAEQMDLRQTPKLKFVYDDSIEYGNKIEKIIADIKEN